MPSPTDYKNTLRVPRSISSIGAGTFDAVLEKANGVSFEGTNDEPQKILVDIPTPIPNTLREVPMNVVFEGIHGNEIIFPDANPNAKIRCLGKGFTDEALRGKIPLIRNAKTANTYAGGTAGYILGDITGTSSSLEWDITSPHQPDEISTKFFDFDTANADNTDRKTNLLEKIALCNAILKTDRMLKIVVHPGDVIKRRTKTNLAGGATTEEKNPQNNTGVEFAKKRHIHWMSGEYLNTWSNYNLVALQSTVPCFQFNDDFTWTQDKSSLVHLSNVDGNVWMLHPRNQIGAYRNLKVDGMYWYQSGVQPATGGASFLMGNTRGIEVHNVVWDQVKGYFSIGGVTNSPVTAKHASMANFSNLKFINCATLGLPHLLNVDGAIIDNVYIRYDEECNFTTAGGYITISPLDVEPDFPDAYVRNVKMSKVIFDMKRIEKIMIFTAAAIQGTRWSIKNFNLKDVTINMDNPEADRMPIGMEIYGVDGGTFEDIKIKDGYANAVRVRACKGITVKGIRGENNGDYEGNGSALVVSEGNIDSHFEDIKASSGAGGVYEREIRVQAHSDGTAFIYRGGEIRDYDFLVGEKLSFNGVEYTILQNDYGWDHNKIRVDANVPALNNFNINKAAGSHTDFAKTAHGLNTGALVKFAFAHRYAIRVDADNLQFAETYQNAMDGIEQTVVIGSTGDHEVVTYFEGRWCSNTYNVKNLSQIVGESKDVRPLEAAAPMGALPTITGSLNYNPNDTPKEAYAKLFANAPDPDWYAGRFFHIKASDLIGVFADGGQITELPNMVSGQTFKFTQSDASLRGTFHLVGLEGRPVIRITNNSGYTGNEDFPSTAGGFAFAIIGRTIAGVNSGHYWIPLHNVASPNAPNTAAWFFAIAHAGDMKWYNGGDVATLAPQWGTKQIILGRTGATESAFYRNGVDETDDDTKIAIPARLHIGNAFSNLSQGAGMEIEELILWNDDLSDVLATEFYNDRA